MSEKHQSSETADQRPEKELDSLDKDQGRSRLAREAKIGLAVIFFLLAVFGVVLYYQVNRAGESPAASSEAASSQAEDQGKPAAEQSEAANPLADLSQPTIIPARPGSDEEVQQIPSSRVASWGVVAEDSQPMEGDAGITPPSSPPSFKDPLPTPWRSAGAGDAQVGASEAEASPPPLLTSSQVSPAAQLDPRQADDPSQSWSEPGNPLRAQPAATGLAGNTGQDPYSDRSGYARQNLEPLQDNQGGTAQAEMPAGRASPYSTYRAASPTFDPTQQVEVSGRNAAQTDPTLPSGLSQSPALGGIRQQYPAARSAGKDGTYVVQPNDSYWVISERLYGTGAYFRALAHHNRAKVTDENRLPVGGEILAPDASELEQAYPDLCPKPGHRDAAQRRALLASTQSPIGARRVYVVQQGDNLFDIARYELGKATRWTEIVNLNQELLGSDLDHLNYLTPGMRLVLPGDQPAASVARQPGSLYQR